MPKMLPLFLATVLIPTGAVAQVAVPTSPYEVFRLADRQGWVLRVTAADGSHLDGRVREVGPETVRLERGRVRLAEVRLVERGERIGGGGRTGMWLGGAAGVGLLLLLLSQAPIENGEGSGAGALLAIGGAFGVGAVVGGLIGAGLDPGETEWRTIWPATADD